MKKLTLEQITKLFDRAKKERSRHETRFDQAFRYLMPGRASFVASGDLDKQVDDVFDETAVVCQQEFASRFQAAMTPNHSRWASLDAGGDIPPEARPTANKDLDAVTEEVFSVIHGSNFSQESYEAYLDLSVSLGALEVAAGDALDPVINNAIPMTRLWVLNGPNDQIDKFFWTKSMTLEDIEVAYPEATINPETRKRLMESGETTEVLVATIRDWSEPATERHHRYIILIADKEIIFTVTYTGIGSCPVIAFRWSKAAGEVWGSGPGLNVLPAVKVCNAVIQMVLENAQMAIGGVYNAEDDGVVNPDTIELLPGTIIPHAPGSRGLQPVPPAGNFNVADIILADCRSNIKRGLYNDMLGNPNKTPMSATEVAERMADLSRQIGSAFGRIWSEFCIRYVERVVFILKQMKRIELPVVNGREVRVRAISPLAQAQAQIDIQNSDRLVELVAARFGPQLANVFIKGEEMSAYWADKLQVPGKLVRTKPEMEKLLAAIQQMATAAAPQAPAGGPPVA